MANVGTMIEHNTKKGNRNKVQLFRTSNLAFFWLTQMKGISQSNDNHQIEIKIIQLYGL